MNLFLIKTKNLDIAVFERHVSPRTFALKWNKKMLFPLEIIPEIRDENLPFTFFIRIVEFRKIIITFNLKLSFFVCGKNYVSFQLTLIFWHFFCYQFRSIFFKIIVIRTWFNWFISNWRFLSQMAIKLHKILGFFSRELFLDSGEKHIVVMKTQSLRFKRRNEFVCFCICFFFIYSSQKAVTAFSNNSYTKLHMKKFRYLKTQRCLEFSEYSVVGHVFLGKDEIFTWRIYTLSQKHCESPFSHFKLITSLEIPLVVLLCSLSLYEIKKNQLCYSSPFALSHIE